MSGGFFRGTSADQDTRFSNKQAKLLKSQKFAPELDHLVDMTKVKKEVMEPWIARRVTELLGFEDEVLINFIYTLLEGKEVNGKEVQIALTGFMEKNTGKFMKELWTLLLSAQQNASGVPQHLLDTKAEEVQKKQAYDDQIMTRIEKIREEESNELLLGRLKKMDDGVETKATDFDMELASRGLQPKGSTAHPGDDEDVERRNSLRGRNRKSRSESRSPEGERRSSSSERVNHSSRGRSITPRARHSPKISLSPSRRSYSWRRSRSPLGSKSPSPRQRRFGSYRHKSPSSMHHRSPSPIRHRRLPSPMRRRKSPLPIKHRRSPSPVRRCRSPSPVRRRKSPSPVRLRKSPLPIRCRKSPSPVRRCRSPSPVRRRRSPSPVRRRRSPSPVKRCRSPSPDKPHRSHSPFQHGSPSLERHRLPSPVHGKSPSPMRSDTSSPVQHLSVSPLPRRYQRSTLTSHRRSVSPAQRSPIPSRQRLQTPHDGSASPYGSSSPSSIRRKSSPLSRKSPREYRISPAQTVKEKARARQNLSSAPRRPSSPLRSPLRNPKDKDSRHEVPSPSPSPNVSPRWPKSPMSVRKRRLREDQSRSSTPDEVTMRQRQQQLVHDGSLSLQKSREQNARNASPEISKEEEKAEHIRERRDYKSRSSQKLSAHSPLICKQKDSPVRVHNKNDQSSERLSGRSQHGDKSEKSSSRGVNSGASDVQISPMLSHTSLLEKKKAAFKEAGKRSDERNRGSANKVKDSHQGHESETPKMVVEKVDQTNGDGALNSDSEEIGKFRTENKEKRKHKRSHRRELTSEDDESYDSEIEDRKEAKRRRKEEKKLRKEKRRRREERRLRKEKEKEERRAEKLKLKDNSDINSSDYKNAGRPDSHRSDNEEAHDEEKKLEIELRKKALELYKVKKGISH